MSRAQLPGPDPDGRLHRTLLSLGRASVLVAGLAGAVGACGGGAAPMPPPSPPQPESPAPSAPAEGSSPAPAPPPCEDGDLVACTHGCNEERWEDCATLGAIYLDGQIVQRDEGRALTLFRQACDGRSARGCIRLADAHHAGLIDDPVEEAHLYELACEGGANAACLAAGRAYVEGHGVLMRAERAARLFEPACLRGNAAACFELARLLLAGEGVQLDREKALQLLSKACQLGSEPACIYEAREENAAQRDPHRDEDAGPPDVPDLPDEADLE